MYLGIFKEVSTPHDRMDGDDGNSDPICDAISNQTVHSGRPSRASLVGFEEMESSSTGVITYCKVRRTIHTTTASVGDHVWVARSCCGGPMNGDIIARIISVISANSPVDPLSPSSAFAILAPICVLSRSCVFHSASHHICPYLERIARPPRLQPPR